MRTSHVGRLEVSVIGLGCNNFGRALDREGSGRVVQAALDAGMTFFDTADSYGQARAEAYLGAALGRRRDEAVIATKFGMPVAGVDGSGGGRPEYVRRAAERSLRELGTDRIDLYQLHKPDPATPMDETLGAMAELMQAGKVLEIGCSNLSAEQLAAAIDASTTNMLPRFVSNQVEYSLLDRTPETGGLVDIAVREGVAILPFYPLASGLLTGKVRRGEQPQGRLSMGRYQRFLTDRNFAVVDELRSFAAARQREAVHVALAWLLGRPTVPSVTAGATTAEQVVTNAAAADWVPSDEDVAQLDAIVARFDADARPLGA